MSRNAQRQSFNFWRNEVKVWNRFAAAVAIALIVCCMPAFAEEAPTGTTELDKFYWIWGIAHVGISLAGTVFTLWLIRRGVKRL